MNKKKIIQLALGSYSGKDIDEKKVNTVSSYLSRADLKKYINALKNLENNKKLIVSAPSENVDMKSFEKIFPDKRIVFKKDPSLLLGIQIVDNDIEYKFSLKNSLEKIISYLEKDYD